jgi:hypothetical protein
VDTQQMLDQLVAAGGVKLVCLTDEEMASIDADRDTPFRPAEPPERLRSLAGDTRTAVLTTALRSLVARDLIEPPREEDLQRTAEGATIPLRPLGELDTILAIRRAPTAVVFVGQASYLAALHGFKENQVRGFLEERIDQRGLHYFTLLTAEQAVEAVAALADPDCRAPSGGPALGEPADEIPGDITRALRDFGPGVTRIDAYHSRPAGTRRIEVSVLVRPGTACVVRSAFGVAPDRPRLLQVNTAGLRQVLEDALSDPGGDLRSDVTRQAAPHYRCPVCGYPGLDEPPRTEESGPSYEICPSCGFEFGVTDDDRGIGYEQWRREWIAGGMRWWSRRPVPAGWDPRAQLRDLQGSGTEE